MGQKLIKDFNKDIDSSDVLGDAAKYVKLINELQDMVAAGEMPCLG